MKIFKLLFVILFLPVYSFCQSLTGLWIGSLSNDSNTIRKDQSFEMALTEYRGKVYGYSHTTFMVHDTLFYIVKRVKGFIDGDVCEVKDDELISCNFLSKQDRGVKQIYTFRLNKEDSIWRLDGEWKTNKTKKYYSISGSVKTATEKNLSKSKLFPHLQELNLTDAVATLLPPKKEAAPVVKQPEAREPVVAKAEPNKKTEAPPVKSEKAPTITATSQQDIAKSNTDKENKKEQTQPKTEPVITPQTEIAKSNTEKENKKEQTQPKTEPAITPQTETAKSKAEPEKKKEDVVVKKEITPDAAAAKPKEKVVLAAKPPVVAAINVEKRKSEMVQTINFKADSLVLSLYDNGEIDGDTVSVLINGEVILANQGLKATAIKKTVYITPAMQDSFTLVLYAENLGKYPPNTGLIIVHDGEDTYQVRFSADLQKNVAVNFKRKKK